MKSRAEEGHVALQRSGRSCVGSWKPARAHLNGASSSLLWQDDLKWCAGKSLERFSGHPTLQIKAPGSNVFLPLSQCHATWLHCFALLCSALRSRSSAEDTSVPVPRAAAESHGPWRSLSLPSCVAFGALRSFAQAELEEGQPRGSLGPSSGVNCPRKVSLKLNRLGETPFLKPQAAMRGCLQEPSCPEGFCPSPSLCNDSSWELKPGAWCEIVPGRDAMQLYV